MGNAVQANSIASAFEIAFHINPMIVGIVVAVLAGLIFFGGTKNCLCDGKGRPFDGRNVYYHFVCLSSP